MLKLDQTGFLNSNSAWAGQSWVEIQERDGICQGRNVLKSQNPIYLTNLKRGGRGVQKRYFFKNATVSRFGPGRDKPFKKYNVKIGMQKKRLSDQR